jgi:hypothetical protein
LSLLCRGVGWLLLSADGSQPATTSSSLQPLDLDEQNARLRPHRTSPSPRRTALGTGRSALDRQPSSAAPESVISSAPRWQLVEVTLFDRAVTFEAVHAVASVAAERTKVWWRELQVLLVAGSGLVLGECVAFAASQLDVDGRRISVDRQIVETRSVVAAVRTHETDPRSGLIAEGLTNSEIAQSRPGSENRPEMDPSSSGLGAASASSSFASSTSSETSRSTSAGSSQSHGGRPPGPCQRAGAARVSAWSTILAPFRNSVVVLAVVGTVVVGLMTDDVEVLVEIDLSLAAIIEADLDAVGGTVVAAFGLDDGATAGLLQGSSGRFVEG